MGVSVFAECGRAGMKLWTEIGSKWQTEGYQTVFSGGFIFMALRALMKIFGQLLIQEKASK